MCIHIVPILCVFLHRSLIMRAPLLIVVLIAVAILAKHHSVSAQLTLEPPSQNNVVAFREGDTSLPLAPTGVLSSSNIITRITVTINPFQRSVEGLSTVQVQLFYYMSHSHILLYRLLWLYPLSLSLSLSLCFVILLYIFLFLFVFLGVQLFDSGLWWCCWCATD